MAHKFEFVEGDTGSKLRITCKREGDSTPIDLTGASLALKWRNQAGVVQAQAMDIEDAAAGIAFYQFAAGELEAGRMHFTVRITDVSANVLHSTGYVEVPVRKLIA